MRWRPNPDLTEEGKRDSLSSESEDEVDEEEDGSNAGGSNAKHHNRNLKQLNNPNNPFLGDAPAPGRKGNKAGQESEGSSSDSSIQW